MCCLSLPTAHAGPLAERWKLAQRLGNHSEVLPQALSHAEINEQLGLPNAYTQAVERFLSRLHPSWATLFAQ